MDLTGEPLFDLSLTALTFATEDEPDAYLDTNKKRSMKMQGRKIVDYNKKKQTKKIIATLITADSVVSLTLNILSPTAFASILNPSSAVVTARRFPSLLNLKQGRL